MIGTVIIVQAMTGREDTTQATLDSLDQAGGAAQLTDTPRVLFWSGERPPRLTLPPGWVMMLTGRPPEGHRRDLWHVLRFAQGYGPETDLVLFEDDVIACRNAVRYIVGFDDTHLTTFCKLRRTAPGIYSAHGFHGTMSLKVPARLLARLCAAGPDSRHVNHSIQNGDTRIAHLLIEWGELVNHHRSLAQHVGEISICKPGAKLRGNGRAPASDFDASYDPFDVAPRIELVGNLHDQLGHVCATSGCKS